MLPILEVRDVKKLSLVLVTGDRGLCGGYNSQVIKQCTRRIEKLKAQGIATQLILVGRKGEQWFVRRPTPVAATFVLGNVPQPSVGSELANLLVAQFLTGEIDAAEIIYTRFNNLISSTPTIRTLLPLSITGIESEEDEVFKVTTKVFSSSVRVFVVQRRYSDFEWLHAQLSSAFAGVIIPPLPEKSYIGRFSAEFVESRQRGLEKFLARVLNHKLLAKCKDLPTFVLADERNLESAKLACKEVEVQKSKGLFDYFSDLSASLSSSFAAQPGRPRSVDDVTCDDISAYAASLGSTLHAADVNTDKLLAQSKGACSACVFLEIGGCAC